MSIIMYVGIDVHMETFSICSYKSSEDKFYYEKTLKAESKNVIKYLETIKNEIYNQTAEEVNFVCGYEAEAKSYNDAWIKLDETGVTPHSCNNFKEKIGLYNTKNWDKENKKIIGEYSTYLVNDSYHVDDSYCQLYIPYSTFKSACQQIKSVYSANPQGYFNYMKYWARNGEYNQICDYGENTGAMDGTIKVNNTYLASNFWNHYDGTKDPVTGQVWKDEKGNVKKANGWK